jgi:hypothetical protein
MVSSVPLLAPMLAAFYIGVAAACCSGLAISGKAPLQLFWTASFGGRLVALQGIAPMDRPVAFTVLSIVGAASFELFLCMAI